MTEGVRHLPTLLAELRAQSVATEAQRRRAIVDFEAAAYRRGSLTSDQGIDRTFSRTVADALDDPNTKRLLFDSRQAHVFMSLLEMGERVPLEITRKLRLPFEQLYVEFTEPIPMPIERDDDILKALLLMDIGDSMSIPYTSAGPNDLIFPAEEGTTTQLTYPTIQIVAFLTGQDDTGTRHYIDRAFSASFQGAMGFVIAEQATKYGSVIDLPGVQPRKGYIPAMHAVTDCPEDVRQFGWWEVFVHVVTHLVFYMTAYTMAKSVVIQPEVMTRQARRRRERGKEPHPWHVVKVEPRFLKSARRGGDDEDTGRGSEHSYRYDVMGHLRFGRHKKGDGTYSHTIEWIAPHQRGLQHTRYIPKTYKVDRGKVVHERMKEYWGDRNSALEREGVA